MTPKEMLNYEKIETLQSFARWNSYFDPKINWLKSRQELIDYIVNKHCPEDLGYKVYNNFVWDICDTKYCSECWNKPFENKEFEAEYFKSLMDEKKQMFCPYCASELKVLHTIGQEDNDVSIITGECQHCHQFYEWKYDRKTYKKFDFKNNI